MEKFNLFSLREAFEKQNVMICFNGPFSHSVIEQLGEAIKKHLQSADAPKDRVADVFSVVIEQAQNLKNYTTSTQLPPPGGGGEGGGTLAIGYYGEHYIVSSGNCMREEDIAPLKEHLGMLCKMDKTELKKLYKKKLREPTEEGEGAGLGLILMARKAAEPIEYSFHDQQNGTAFFNISVVI